jgi:hypothetical protein
LLIRAGTGEIFGAYCSSSWAERRDRVERSRSRFFGTGESFVWRLEGNALEVFRWVGCANANESMHEQNTPQMFMTADDRTLIVSLAITQSRRMPISRDPDRQWRRWRGDRDSRSIARGNQLLLLDLRESDARA